MSVKFYIQNSTLFNNYSCVNENNDVVVTIDNGSGPYVTLNENLTCRDLHLKKSWFTHTLNGSSVEFKGEEVMPSCTTTTMILGSVPASAGTGTYSCSFQPNQD